MELKSPSREAASIVSFRDLLVFSVTIDVFGNKMIYINDDKENCGLAVGARIERN